MKFYYDIILSPILDFLENLNTICARISLLPFSLFPFLLILKATFSEKLNNINKSTAEFITKQMLSQLKYNKKRHSYYYFAEKFFMGKHKISLQNKNQNQDNATGRCLTSLDLSHRFEALVINMLKKYMI